MVPDGDSLMVTSYLVISWGCSGAGESGFSSMGPSQPDSLGFLEMVVAVF